MDSSFACPHCAGSGYKQRWYEALGEDSPHPAGEDIRLVLREGSTLPVGVTMGTYDGVAVYQASPAPKDTK